MQAGIAHLAQWDFGDETTATAFVSGEVYDQLPAGQSGAHLPRLLEAEQRILNRALFTRTTIDGPGRSHRGNKTAPPSGGAVSIFSYAWT